MKKTIALMLAVLLVLAVPTLAEAKVTYSNVISLPKIQKKPVQQETSAEPVPAAETKDDSKLYAAADIASEVLTSYTSDDIVTVISVENGWAKVAVNGIEGYIPESEIPANAIPADAGKPDGEPTEVENESEVFLGTVLNGSENGLPVYAEKSADGEPVGYIPVGSDISVVLTDGEWALVNDGTVEGYVNVASIALVNVEPTEDKKVRTINIVNDLNGATEVVSGTIVTFTAILNGFENDTYTVQWYEAVPGGAFEPMAGETGINLSFPITEENCVNSWRVVVTLIDA